MNMLEGIRVLDLSRVIAGPYCATFLGDLGADVIKVERPPLGDDLRVLRGRNGMSASFGAINRNKRGIALDLQSPEGAKIAFDPVAETTKRRKAIEDWRRLVPAGKIPRIPAG